MNIKDFKELPKDWVFKEVFINKINPIKECSYCGLNNKDVEASGLWHCPNPKCRGPGGSWFRSTLKSYKDIGNSHTVDEDEWEQKSDEYILNLIEKEALSPKKQLRTFEFEGYIGETELQELQERNMDWHKDAFEDRIGHRCTNVFSENIFNDSNIWTEEDTLNFPIQKVSKWKITMEEIT